MIFTEQKPTPQLGNFIHKFWYCKSDNYNSSHLVIPYLHHELVFNFSNKYHVKEISSKTMIENPEAWVNGIQTKPYLVDSSGSHEMLGVLFKPNGLKAFTHCYSREFENSFVDAALVFGNPFIRLIEQIKNTALGLEKISLVENYLLDNLNDRAHPKYLTHSINIFSLPPINRYSIKETCNQVSVSKKSLVNSFNKHIGVTPAKYLHLQTINHAISLLLKNPQQSLTTLAYKLNFYDQAHFTNLFKSITSLTPSQYSKFLINNKIDKTSPCFISL